MSLNTSWYGCQEFSEDGKAELLPKCEAGYDHTWQHLGLKNAQANLVGEFQREQVATKAPVESCGRIMATKASGLLQVGKIERGLSTSRSFSSDSNMLDSGIYTILSRYQAYIDNP